MLRKGLVLVSCCLLLTVGAASVTGIGGVANDDSVESASDSSSRLTSTTTDTITITVNDSSNGNDTAVEEITVQTENSVSTYTNSNGVVGSRNLSTAFNDWQTGELDSQTLSKVFSAWQSGEPVA